MKELWQKYHAENTYTINEKRKCIIQIEVDCEVCRCKVKQRNIGNVLRGEAVTKVGGDMVGGKGGQN